MASRYDYQDPGTDPTYCNGLGGHPGIERHCTKCGESVWVSRDEEYQVQVFCERCADRPVDPPADPAEFDVQMAMTAAHRLQEAILATTTLERAHVLKGLTRQFQALADLIDRQASAKIDEILERRR